VQACNLNVKDKILQYQAMMNDVVDATAETEKIEPCAIVVSDYDRNNAKEENDDEAVCADSSAHRNSIISNSSVDSTRSDNNGEKDVNIEYGSSVFYVVWD
jgi:hypothetical protein